VVKHDAGDNAAGSKSRPIAPTNSRPQLIRIAVPFLLARFLFDFILVTVTLAIKFLDLL
jgi:hypothetical protein